MFSKIVILACALVAVNAGAIGVPAAVTSYAAPPAYTNYAAPAIATSYAAPGYSHGYAASTLSATSDNVYRSYGNLQTVSTHSKSIATPFSSSNKHFTSVTNPGVYAHSAPVAVAAPTYAAAPVAHATYAAAPVAHATYAAEPVAHATYSAAPVAHATYAAAPGIAHGKSLLGVAYSPSVAVSHMSYSSPIGINYSW